MTDAKIIGSNDPLTQTLDRELAEFITGLAERHNIDPISGATSICVLISRQLSMLCVPHAAAFFHHLSAETLGGFADGDATRARINAVEHLFDHGQQLAEQVRGELAQAIAAGRVS